MTSREGERAREGMVTVERARARTACAQLPIATRRELVWKSHATGVKHAKTCENTRPRFFALVRYPHAEVRGLLEAVRAIHAPSTRRRLCVHISKHRACGATHSPASIPPSSTNANIFQRRSPLVFSHHDDPCLRPCGYVDLSHVSGSMNNL